jgi:hypothetical protein
MNLTPGLIKFIKANVQSIDQIETLLLLYRNPTRRWRAIEVMAELRTSTQGATNSLTHLAKRDLCNVKDDQTYAFAPKTTELEAAVTELAQAYAERRVSVIEVIYAPPKDPLQEFSDAFRLRPKGDV